jgi:hypothetical protein
MSAYKLLQSIGEKEMDRRDFLKYMLFVTAGIVGLKSLLSLIAAVDINPNLTVTKQPDNTRGNGTYSRGRFND